MGAASVSHATYISPHNWWDVIHPALDELELTPNVTWGELDRLVVAGLSEPTAIAAHLWPAGERDSAYAVTLAGIDQAGRSWATLDEPARRRAWVSATTSIATTFENDPLLPLELAPPSGRPTRQAYRVLNERFLADVEGSDQYSVALEMGRHSLG